MAIYLQGVGTGSILHSVAGVDLTDHVKSITINYDYDDVDITAMGATAKAHAAGLRDDSIEIEYYQDFATGKVDATINGLLGGSGATVIVQTSGTTVSTSNPKYTLVGIPFTYSPMDASVGDASMTKVKFMPAAGQAIVRATS